MITLHLYYTGTDGAARAFAEEMVRRGVVSAIRAEDGSLRYEYYFPMDDPETVLLIDQWRDQAAIDAHHASPMMGEIAALRERYDLQGFDNFICRITGTYVDEDVLTEKDRVDYRKFKPALYQFPTYEYLETGDVLGPCMKMNEAQP